MDLKDTVCRRRCSFYKEGKDEDLACGGYVAIERLADRGIAGSPDSPVAGQAGKQLLAAVLCPSCPFFREDCDHAAGVAGAKPCGGFLVLASWLEGGRLTVDDIRHIL